MKKQMLSVGMAMLLLTGTVSAANLPTIGAEAVDSGVEERTVEKEYKNFRIDNIYTRRETPSESTSEDEVFNRQTGESLLRVMNLESTPDGTYIHSFFPIDDDTLLWSKMLSGSGLAEYHYLKLDGSLEKIEADFQIIAQDSRGRFLVRKDKIPSRRGELFPEGTFRWWFGIVDRDLKTVLLPFEYDEEPKIDIGNKYYSWVPYWRDGYMILKKGGKCGVIDFNLNEVIPFEYDMLHDNLYNTAQYTKGTERGVIFLESGRKIPNCTIEHDYPQVVVVESLDGRTSYIYNRYGELLYESKYNISIEEPIITVSKSSFEKFEVSSVVKASAWAEPEINAARAAGLIPSDVDWLYTKPASRRDFCKLIIQALKTARPDVVRSSDIPSHERFWDVTSYVEYSDETPIADAAETGIVSGFPDGSFRPYAPLTRQDAAVMLARAAKILDMEASDMEDTIFSDISQAGEYARDSISTVAALKTSEGQSVMGGTAPDTFQPLGTYTIEQAIATVYRLYLVEKENTI